MHAPAGLVEASNQHSKLQWFFDAMGNLVRAPVALDGHTAEWLT